MLRESPEAEFGISRNSSPLGTEEKAGKAIPSLLHILKKKKKKQ